MFNPVCKYSGHILITNNIFVLVRLSSHGLPWTKPNNGIYNTRNSQRTRASSATFESCGARATKTGRNLYIEQEKQKLVQIVARNIRMSLDKRIACFVPSKANSWRLEIISYIRNEPKQCIDTRQITKVSNSAWRHADNSGYHADPWPINICHSIGDLMARLYIKFLLITQHEVPSIDASEATKKRRKTEQRTVSAQMSQPIEVV